MGGMAGKEGVQYAVILSINPSTPDRLQHLVPELMKVLQHVSTEVVEPLFRSVGADHFGFLIRSKMKPGHISAIIESPSYGFPTKTIAEPFLAAQDGFVILELGKDYHSPRGFTRAQTWLQRH